MHQYFFANTASFKSRIKKHIGRFLAENNYPKPWCLVLCFSGVNDVDFTGIEMMEQFFEELKEKEIGMTIILTKLKTHVLNALTLGEIVGDEDAIIPKSNILWELHEAEAWWDANKGKLGDKNNDKNGKDNGDDVELLSDDGNDKDNIHGFTATHIANQVHDDDDDNITSNI